jgi:HD-GYP domain-containing protein (c-di-GMP phosphodiesterase class II)
MMAPSNAYLRLSVFHRNLAIRIVAVGIIVAVCLGAITWFQQRKRIIDDVVDLAVLGTKLLNQRIAHLADSPTWPDRDAIQYELNVFLKTTPSGLEGWEGERVYVGILDEKLDYLASVVNEKYPMVEALRKRNEELKAKLKDAQVDMYEVYKLDGVPFLLTATPLFDTKKNRIAFVVTIFAVSHENVEKGYNKIWTTVFIVVGIVILTTFILYPTIVLLTRRLSKLAVNLLDSNMETLKVLGSSIAKRDSDTDAHNYRVSIYAVRIAEAIGLDPHEIRSLIKGALLHDVGKIGVRDNILLKPGKLDHDEFEIMKTHVSHGLDIVKRSTWLRDAIDVVGYHHEKYDGNGYYEGLSETDIPISARIFAIADVFDALTSKRPYKEPFSFQKTMGILEEERGTHFDPDLLDAFNKIAKGLYNDFSGREDDTLKDTLREITRSYFSSAAKIRLGDDLA